MKHGTRCASVLRVRTHTCERCHVDDAGRIERLGVGERVTENQASLGVRVVDL